jgi:hypothetical protein
VVEWKWGGVTIQQSCEEFDQDAWTLKIYTLLQDNGVDCDAITCPSTVTNDCGSAAGRRLAEGAVVADTSIQMTEAQHEKAKDALADLSDPDAAPGIMGVTITDAGAITADIVVAEAQPAAKSVVDWGFDVKEGDYDPTSSPAAYAAALAAEMGDPSITADDLTVSAVQKTDGTWSVSVAVDAGDDAAAAQKAKDELSAKTPAQLETALGLAADSVPAGSVQTATEAEKTADASVSFGFDVAEGEYDPATSPAAYAAALAEKMGDPFTADDFTVTAVKNEDGTWSVSVAVDAGDDAAAAHGAADTLSKTTPAELETALGLTPGSVTEGSISAASAVEYGGVQTEKHTVAFGFDVAADEYDPATSPAAYAAALAAEMGRPFKADDFTVTAVQNADGTWSVSVEVDAGDDAAAAQKAKEELSAKSPADLEKALNLEAGSVSDITPATVAKETAHSAVSYSFVVSGEYDPTAYAQKLAAELAPIAASDITVTAVQNTDGTWSVSVMVNAGTDAAAARRAAAKLESMTEERLASVLGLAAGSVEEVGEPSIAVQYAPFSPTADASPPPAARLDELGPSAQTTADEGPLVGGIVGGIVFVLLVMVLVYFYLKKRDEKAAAAAWLKQENEKAQGPVIVTETPQEPPKTPPAVEPAAVDEEEPNFSGDDDEPHSPKSPGQIFV